MNNSKEFRFKGFNQITGFDTELSQDIDDWLFGHNPRIAENYIDNGFTLRLKIRLWFGKSESEDFCAFFSWPRWTFSGPHGMNNDVILFPVPSSRLTGGKTEGHNICNGINSNQIPVFISITQFSENKEEIPVDVFAISVGLSRFDSLFHGIGDALYFSPITGRFEFLSIIADRKLVSIGWGVAILDNESRYEEIKTRSKLLNRFSNNCRKSKGKLWADNANNALSRIRIRFTNEVISIAINQVIDFRIEILDMLIGPLYFFPNIGEGMISCYHNDMVSKEKDSQEKKQETDKGYEIPIPKKQDFFENLEKASEAEPKKSGTARRSRKDSKKK